MAAEKDTKKFLRRLAEKLVQADVHSLSKKVINSALDKALTSLPALYHSEVIKHKDLYADLLQGYVEELSSEKCQFDLPYNLYLPNDHRKIDRMMSSDFWEQKDLLIKSLLQKKFTTFSSTDILQIMNVAGSSQTQTKIKSLLLDDLYILKAISGRLTDVKSLLKLMSISCRMFMLSAKKSTEVSIRKQINNELKSLLIACKTRFTQLENVSPEETSDYNDYLSALCCLYVESVAMIEFKPATGVKMCKFIVYILKNSFQHQLDVLLQIDEQYLSNEKVLIPFISKTFENKCEDLSCEMYLRYILAVKHICLPKKYKHEKDKIRNILKKSLYLQTPSTFYTWLTTQLPHLTEHLDKDDEIIKFLMTCSEKIMQSLIILLSKKPTKESDSETQIEDDISEGETSETTEHSSKKRKSPICVDLSDDDDDHVVPQKKFKSILGQ